MQRTPYRRAAPRIVASLFVVASACGGRVGSSPGPGDASAPNDASSHDAFQVDARAIRDSRTPLDVTTIRDARLAETAAPVDAPIDVDAMGDAGHDAEDGAGHDAGREGGRDAAPFCDEMCTLGEQECNYDAVDCDAGGSTVCVFATLSTCVQGSSGCSVWGAGAACSESVACCVPCHYVPCFDGGPTQCEVCPSGPLGAPCMQDADCGTDACDAITLTCVDNQCFDRRQDSWETDVDCGGGTCRGCGVGQRCINSFDCISGHFCALPAHVCQ
jgi:hypothetical protein